MRFRGVPGSSFEQSFDRRLVPEKPLEPLQFPQALRIFVNSMSHQFRRGVPNDNKEQVARVMVANPLHTYQVHTKLPIRMHDLLPGRLRFATKPWHIWWGISMEGQRFGLPRLKLPQYSGAAMRFLSVEPMLEDVGPVNFHGIDWVIVGRESGPWAWKMKSEWVLRHRDHCKVIGIPLFC